MKKLNKGFTLIELLVVIAIIGILASVVLASLSTARSKGTDAKVKGQLASVRNAAEIFYGNTNNTYTGLCSVTSTDTTGMYALLQASNYPTAPACASTATAYAVTAAVTGTSVYWCVDSNGASKQVGAPTVSGTTTPSCY